MKILFITALPLETNSSATIQNIALIKGFNELGHEVSLLTTKSKEDDKNYDKSIIKGISIKRKYEIPLGVLYSNLKNKKDIGLISKIKKYIRKPIKWIYSRWEIYDGYKTSIKNIEQVKFDELEYDVIISASDSKSSHLIAEKFIELFPSKSKYWIQYWGDPLYLDVTKKNIFRKRLYNEELRVISKADEIIYVSPMTYEEQKKLYPTQANKMRFIPLGYIKEKQDTNLSEKGYNMQVGYYGYYYSSARNILPLYNSAINSNFNLIIVGEGDITLSERSNIKILPRISFEKVEELEEKSDILVCVCNSKSTQIPGKLYYYSATYKHILVVLDGNKEELKAYLSKFSRFIFCNNDKDDIKRAIEEIAEGKYKNINKPCEILYCKNISEIVLNKKSEFNFNNYKV